MPAAAITDTVRNALAGVALRDQDRAAILALCRALGLAEQFDDPGRNDHTGRHAAAMETLAILDGLMAGPLGWSLAHVRGMAATVKGYRETDLEFRGVLDDPLWTRIGRIPWTGGDTHDRACQHIGRVALAGVLSRLPSLAPPGVATPMVASILSASVPGGGIGFFQPVPARPGRRQRPYVGSLRWRFIEVMVFRAARETGHGSTVGGLKLAAETLPMLTEDTLKRRWLRPAGGLGPKIKEAKAAGVAAYRGERPPAGSAALAWMELVELSGHLASDLDWRGALAEAGVIGA
jgi:hypothetical protein